MSPPVSLFPAQHHVGGALFPALLTVLSAEESPPNVRGLQCC